MTPDFIRFRQISSDFDEKRFQISMSRDFCKIRTFEVSRNAIVQKVRNFVFSKKEPVQKIWTFTQTRYTRES